MTIDASLRNLIRQSICWIATLYGAFAVLQRFHLDQLYVLVTPEISHLSRNPEVGGFISQPVFCAALIAICMPFLLRYGKWWQATAAILGILATGNRSALIVTIICALYATQYRNIGKILLATYVSYLILGIILQFYPMLHLPHMDEERFIIWREILQDFINPKFPGINNSQILTGTGLGSFAIIFPFYHGNGYYQAHNEFLETLRCLGIVGFGLLVYCLSKISSKDFVILNAILASCILAMTNAIWHIPQLAFLTVLLVALAYNKNMGVTYVDQT